ncbi:MAG: hypothetical protein E6J11_20695 [Chloroflexi bacterium]|nr:MAG: hypothetical protein E6J11_20695 [Chloroflexota bacterium]
MQIRTNALLLAGIMLATTLLALVVARPPTSTPAEWTEAKRALDTGGCTTSVCGPYVEMSCHPEVDGFVRYLNIPDRTVIMNCGGACMGGRGPAGSRRCTACPPPEWEACVRASSSK